MIGVEILPFIWNIIKSLYKAPYLNLIAELVSVRFQINYSCENAALFYFIKSLVFALHSMLPAHFPRCLSTNN